jgi:hypothetical protein
MKRIGFISTLVMAVTLAFAASALAANWTPPQHLTWYWQLSGTPKIEPVMATDIDGFDNGAAEVAKLHAAGQRAICYIDVGTSENWRSDYSKFPASVQGSTNGWPGEKWLNVNDLATLEPIMTARFQMCQAAGYDAVEPDNMDGFENSTGFTITASAQATYDEWVANEVHALGMAVFQKNDPEQASTLEPYFDGAIDEQCNEYSECSSFSSYLKADKPVLNAEYSGGSSFCAADNAAGIMGALYSLNLDGSAYAPCFVSSPQGPPITGGGTGTVTGTGTGTGTGAGAGAGTGTGTGTGSGTTTGSGSGKSGSGSGTSGSGSSKSGTGSSKSGSGSSKSGSGKSGKGTPRKGHVKKSTARRSAQRRAAKLRLTWRRLRLMF